MKCNGAMGVELVGRARGAHGVMVLAEMDMVKERGIGGRVRLTNGTILLSGRACDAWPQVL